MSKTTDGEDFFTSDPRNNIVENGQMDIVKTQNNDILVAKDVNIGNNLTMNNLHLHKQF